MDSNNNNTYPNDVKYRFVTNQTLDQHQQHLQEFQQLEEFHPITLFGTLQQLNREKKEILIHKGIATNIHIEPDTMSRTYSSQQSTDSRNSSFSESNLNYIDSMTETLPSKNPIYYTKDELKNCSKWDKYVNKIHYIIMDEIPNMCLVEKTNTSFKNETSDSSNVYVSFECRFQGVAERQMCHAIITEDKTTLFEKTKSTPRKLYKSIKHFIEYTYTDIILDRGSL